MFISLNYPIHSALIFMSYLFPFVPTFRVICFVLLTFHDRLLVKMYSSVKQNSLNMTNNFYRNLVNILIIKGNATLYFLI